MAGRAIYKTCLKTRGGELAIATLKQWRYIVVGSGYPYFIRVSHIGRRS